MPFCSFAQEYAMMGSTPVDNLFIMNYLPHAPGDYVKVYLYGLMASHYPDGELTLERCAHFLDIKEDIVLTAMQYWERQGLVRRISDKPPRYLFLPPAASMMAESPAEREIYRHRDFNNHLQKLFGTRLLHPSEFTMACEWLDDLKLPEEVVYILVEHYIATHPPKFQFSGLNRMALRWAEEGVFTVEAAQDAVLSQTAAYKLASQVLRQFNLRRKPTRDEIALAKKWQEEWNLSPEAVLAACKETVKARNPSFAYLDGILNNAPRTSDAQDMRRALDESHDLDSAIKRLHDALGIRSMSPTAQERESYSAYLQAGFEPEAVYRVAVEVGRNGSYDMATLERKLAEFMERGQYTLAAVDVYLAENDRLREQAVRVLDACSVNRKPTAAEITKIAGWAQDLPMEVILYAAGLSAGAKVPLMYMEKILSDWQTAGVKTLQDAQSRRSPKTDVGARQYTQREYAATDFDSLFTNLEGEGDAK